jgi:glucose/arabinose dehydrogenase
VFVGNRSGQNVYAVRDEDGDGRAERQWILFRGGRMPNGVAFRDGALYVAEVSRVLRFDQIEDRLDNPPAPVVVYDRFPTDRHHGWKFIRFGPDGMLYVPVGAPCNVCLRSDDERYASITRMRPDGSGLEVFAHGVRNTVGFDWHPETGELWFTDNGRDWMGDDLPPDELNRAPRQGLHFGFPFFHGRGIPDPEFSRGRRAADYVEPVQNLGPHVAALGMRFYTGKMFPAEYRNQIFIAEHGSWNRSRKIGYRVMLVRLEGHRATSYEVFAEGWLEGESVWGRPVDVEVLPDGSLLVSDDHAGAIYRITYRR